jgi:hypothetical protein
VGVNILGAAPHVFLLEVADPFAYGGFDFALCLHNDLAWTQVQQPQSEPQALCIYRESGRHRPSGTEPGILIEVKNYSNNLLDYLSRTPIMILVPGADS